MKHTQRHQQDVRTVDSQASPLKSPPTSARCATLATRSSCSELCAALSARGGPSSRADAPAAAMTGVWRHLFRLFREARSFGNPVPAPRELC